MQSENRKHYRAQPDPKLQLHATVKAVSGVTWQGPVMDASIGGISVLFPDDAAPCLPIGEEVTIALHTVEDERGMEVPSQLVHWHQSENGPLFGFRFDDLLLEEKMSRKLLRLFNRRAAFRIAPDPRTEVLVRLYSPADPENTVTARLLDISVLGLGILVEKWVERFLFPLDVIACECDLPGPTAVRVVAETMDRRLKETRIVYGLRFLPDLTTNFEHQQLIIGEYIARREREEMRDKVHAPV